MALPGVLTGLILALSRAIGETAPLITIGALTYIPFAPDSVWSQVHGAANPDLQLGVAPTTRVPHQCRGRDPGAVGVTIEYERRRHHRARSISATGAHMTREWSGPDGAKSRGSRQSRRSIGDRARQAAQDRCPRFELLLRRQAGAGRHHHPDPAEPRHRLHRPVRVRQEHLPAHVEPDERHHPGDARRRRASPSTARTSTVPASTSSSCAARSAWCSRNRTRSRSRFSRTSPTACGSTASPSRRPR